MGDNLPFEITAVIFAHQLMGLNSVNNRLFDSEMSISRIMERVGALESQETIEQHLKDLTEAGTLRARNTSSYGYGDHYEPGPICYSITEQGIVELLFYSPVSGSLRQA